MKLKHISTWEDSCMYSYAKIFSILHFSITFFAPFLLHDMFLELLVAAIVSFCLYFLSESIGSAILILISVLPAPIYGYLIVCKVFTAYRMLENADLFDSDDKVYAVPDDAVDMDEESVWGESTAHFKKPTPEKGEREFDDEDNMDDMSELTSKQSYAQTMIVSIPAGVKKHLPPGGRLKPLYESTPGSFVRFVPCV